MPNLNELDQFKVTGGEQFYALSKALKEAGEGDLRKELNKGLRNAAKPLIKDTRASALQILPKRGGLARLVSKEPQRAQVRTGQKTAGVRIVVGKSHGGARSANKGVVRHPVFWNQDRRRVWVQQKVKPGWFDQTLTEKGPEKVRPEIEAAVNRIVEQVIARSQARQNT